MESFFFAWNSIFLVVGFSLAWTYFFLQVKIIYLKFFFGEFCIFSLVFPFNYFNGKKPQNLTIMKIGKLVQLALSLQELSLCFQNSFLFNSFITYQEVRFICGGVCPAVIYSLDLENGSKTYFLFRE